MNDGVTWGVKQQTFKRSVGRFSLLATAQVSVRNSFFDSGRIELSFVSRG